MYICRSSILVASSPTSESPTSENIDVLPKAPNMFVTEQPTEQREERTIEEWRDYDL